MTMAENELNKTDVPDNNSQEDKEADNTEAKTEIGPEDFTIPDEDDQTQVVRGIFPIIF